MSEKKNFWNQCISAMNGVITFGKISPKGDVTSSLHLQALDGRHFMSFDEDGPRTGFTLLNSPRLSCKLSCIPCIPAGTGIGGAIGGLGVD